MSFIMRLKESCFPWKVTPAISQRKVKQRYLDSAAGGRREARPPGPPSLAPSVSLLMRKDRGLKKPETHKKKKEAFKDISDSPDAQKHPAHPASDISKTTTTALKRSRRADKTQSRARLQISDATRRIVEALHEALSRFTHSQTGRKPAG